MSAFIFVLIILFSAACNSNGNNEVVSIETPSLVLYETPTPAQFVADPTPVIEPTIPPTATPTPFLYTVEAGDTMIGIAYTYNLEPDVLIAANPGIDPRFLSVSAQLIIPFSGVGGVNIPTPVAVDFDSDEPVCYLTLIKDAWCFWLIENNTRSAYENISARFRLYGRDGVEINSGLGMIPINRLMQGQKMPVIGYIPAEVSEWSLVQAQIETLVQAPEDSGRYLPIELISSDVVLGEGKLYADVSGVMKLGNTETSASVVWAAVTAFDDKGNVVGSRRWESEQGLELNTELEMNITIYSMGRPIDSVEIILEARP